MDNPKSRRSWVKISVAVVIVIIILIFTFLVIVQMSKTSATIDSPIVELVEDNSILSIPASATNGLESQRDYLSALLKQQIVIFTEIKPLQILAKIAKGEVIEKFTGYTAPFREDHETYRNYPIDLTTTPPQVDMELGCGEKQPIKPNDVLKALRENARNFANAFIPNFDNNPVFKSIWESPHAPFDMVISEWPVIDGTEPYFSNVILGSMNKFVDALMGYSLCDNESYTSKYVKEVDIIAKDITNIVSHYFALLIVKRQYDNGRIPFDQVHTRYLSFKNSINKTFGEYFNTHCKLLLRVLNRNDSNVNDIVKYAKNNAQELASYISNIIR